MDSLFFLTHSVQSVSFNILVLILVIEELLVRVSTSSYYKSNILTSRLKNRLDKAKLSTCKHSRVDNSPKPRKEVKLMSTPKAKHGYRRIRNICGQWVQIPIDKEELKEAIAREQARLTPISKILGKEVVQKYVESLFQEDKPEMNEELPF